MKRGTKALLPSEKDARGTYQPCRDAARVELVEPNTLPQRPDWLTAAGEEVWLDDIGRVGHGKLVSERDSTMFATYCNIVGALNLAWRAGEVPPASHLSEARKLAEIFGICGARSRMKTGGNDGQTGNPFARNAARS